MHHPQENDDFSPIADRAVQWTRSVLTGEHMQWLESLPAGPVSPSVPDASCVHGSPADEDEYLVSADDTNLAFRAAKARITFFGHTHIQVGFATDGEELFTVHPLYSSDDDLDEYELPLRRGFKYLLNPRLRSASHAMATGEPVSLYTMMNELSSHGIERPTTYAKPRKAYDAQGCRIFWQSG